MMSARLRMMGELDEPRDFDFAALRAIDEQLVESSPLLAGREIAAVRLSRLLALAGVQPNARSLVAETADGRYLTALPIDAADRCLIVYRVGEAALPLGLGGPFRLLTQGRIGSSDIKALGAIYASDRPYLDDSDTERIVRVRA
jgi:DMSO/TMAO reductase YedYZ molybdopterin-dependent catalytic subunit